MGNLTETFSFKLSKDDKKFLDSLYNPSKYLRELIRRQKRYIKDIDDISFIVEEDGKKSIAFNREELEAVIIKHSDDIVSKQMMPYVDSLIKD